MSNESRLTFLMPSHALTNFEIQKFYQNKPKLNDLYSMNNWSKIKDGAYKTNLNECESIYECWKWNKLW